MNRSRTLGSLFGLGALVLGLFVVGLFVVGCDDSSKQPSRAHAPAAAPAASTSASASPAPQKQQKQKSERGQQQQPQPAPETLPPLEPNATRALYMTWLHPEPRPSIDVLVENARASFEAGQKAYGAGQFVKAREQFDRTVQLIFSSGFPVD